MDIGSGKDDSEKALGAFREKLKTMGVEVREADVRTNADSGDTGGTALFAALNGALSEAPPDRVAWFVIYSLILAGLLIWVCWLKGERPRWRWGGEE